MESPFLNGGMIGPTLNFGANDRYIVSFTQGRDQLVYVGGQTGTATNSDATVTFNLTGGVATTPAANDLVIAAYVVGTNNSINPALSITSGYTTVATLFATDTHSTDMIVSYKLMGATPDTTFTRSTTGNTSHGGAWALHVWRNVDQTTPLDVASTTVTAADTPLVNPAAITPTSANSVIVVAGGSGHMDGTDTFTASYLSNFRTQGQGGTTVDASVGIGSVAWTSGAYDPAAWTFSGTNSTAYSYAGVTMAVRPRLINYPNFGNLKNSGVWNLEAAYDYAYSQYTPPSQVAFTTVGTTNWTVPTGITEISAVCIGGGGGGSGGDGGRGETNTGGSGGGLAYGTFPVTPGEVLTVVVGGGGASASGSAGAGGTATTISRGATVLLSGGGGLGGQEQNGSFRAGGASSGTERDGGGAGGENGTGTTGTSGGTGGGGAGGYSAAGGKGGSHNAAGSASTGGGGGGGGGFTGTTAAVAGSGGGTGLLGAGSNGTGGSTSGGGGGGGSGGTAGSTNSTTNTGSLYGGGGGGRTDSSGLGAPGGQGAARIIWGAGRSYPSTNTGDVL